MVYSKLQYPISGPLIFIYVVQFNTVVCTNYVHWTPQTLMVQNASQFVSHHICNSIYFQETGVTKLTWDKRGLEHLIHQRCQLYFCFTLSQSEILLVVIMQFSRSYFIWTPPFQHKLARACVCLKWVSLYHAFRTFIIHLYLL